MPRYGRLERFRKLLRRTHAADAFAAPSGRCFNQKRVAKTFGMTPSLVERFHRPASMGGLPKQGIQQDLREWVGRFRSWQTHEPNLG